MNDNLNYGPQAQTPAQRTQVLRQMQATNPDQYAQVTSEVQALYTRYIAGELSWKQVQALRATAEPLPFPWSEATRLCA